MEVCNEIFLCFFFLFSASNFFFFSLFSATSSLAWPAHGGCTVLVDDTSSISDEAHPGQAASRGNPQHPLLPAAIRYPYQPPSGPLRQLYIVYERPQEGLLEPSAPRTPQLLTPGRRRRMRRSVSHDLPPPTPPSMDTHPVDSPNNQDSSSSSSSTATSDTPHSDSHTSEPSNPEISTAEYAPASNPSASDSPASNPSASDPPASNPSASDLLTDTDSLGSDITTPNLLSSTSQDTQVPPLSSVEPQVTNSHSLEPRTLTTHSSDSKSQTSPDSETDELSLNTDSSLVFQSSEHNTNRDRYSHPGSTDNPSHFEDDTPTISLVNPRGPVASAATDKDNQHQGTRPPPPPMQLPPQQGNSFREASDTPPNDNRPQESQAKSNEHHSHSNLSFDKVKFVPREGASVAYNAFEEATEVKATVQFKVSEKSGNQRVPADDTPTDNRGKSLHEESEPADDVFDPVIDVVEYADVQVDSELPENDGLEIVEDYADVDNDAYDSPDDDDDEDGNLVVFVDDDDAEGGEDYSSSNNADDENGKLLVDYVYGHHPESDSVNGVEYVTENDTLETQALPSTDYPRAYEAIPAGPMVTNLGNNVTLESFPASLGSSINPMDVMLGDDPGDSRGEAKAKRGYIPFRSWMGAFPTVRPYAGRAVKSGPRGNGQIYPEGHNTAGNSGQRGATWVSRPAVPESAVNESAETSSSVSRKMKPRKMLTGSVDTWFTRYGREELSSADGSVGEITEDNSEDADGRMIRRSAAGEQHGRSSSSSYDPNDPEGGPIPQSDPHNYPSRILESLGVPHYLESTKSPEYYYDDDDDVASYRGPRLAKEVFPHIFDYDLDDHDDYYYDDDTNYYYFDDYPEENLRPQKEKDDFEDVHDEDESDDVIFDVEDTVGKVKAGYRDPKSVVTLNSMPKELRLQPTSAPISATQYPPGLKVLSLTKEEFHVAIPEPDVKVLPDGQDEVVEIEVVPLRSRGGSASSFETGPNYSPANDNRGRLEIRATEEDPVETTASEATTTQATRPPPPPPPTTSTKPPAISTPASEIGPSPAPHLVPLQLAKFLPTRSPLHETRSTSVPTQEGLPQHHRSSDFSKKIPKFLMHKTEHNSASPWIISSGQYLEAAAGPLTEPRYPGSTNQSESDSTPLNREPPSSAHENSWNSQPSGNGQINLEESGHGTHSSIYENPIFPPQGHSREHTSSSGLSRGKDVSSQEDPATHVSRRPDRSPHDSDATQHLVQTQSRRSKRVTVNVTIATEDETQVSGGSRSSNKPLYVLSVSVPTSGKGQEADITLVEPADHQQIAAISLSVLGNNNTQDIRVDNDNPYETNQSTEQNRFPSGGTASRLVSDRSEPGQCQCSCPCDSSGGDSHTNSIPIPPLYLTHTVGKDSLEGIVASDSVAASPTDGSDSPTSLPRGCVVDANLPTTTSTARTPPQWVVEELEGEMITSSVSPRMEPELITNPPPGKGH